MVQESLERMEEMDNLIIEIAEEAIRYDAQEALRFERDAGNFPISEVDLRNISKLRLVYINSDYALEAAVQYLLQLPEIWPHWRGTSRAILNLHSRTRKSRHPEWRLWTAQI